MKLAFNLHPKRSTMNKEQERIEPEEDFNFDLDEDGGYTDCPKCSRHYDDIDREYQSCSKCGWDAAKETWGKATPPTDEDYMNGDADILTGRWY